MATACFAIVAAVVALVFCSLAPAWATDVAESAPERISPEEFARLPRISAEEVAREAFELWNDCQPIAFSVHLQGENEASKIGLTKEAIETAVRSRLRGARIFRDNPDLRSQPLTLERNGFLGVRVRLGGTTVSWDIWLEKLMEDMASDIVGWTPTGWRKGAHGVHGDDGYYILSSIAPAIDEFIDDYLRVNQSACAR